MKDYHVTLGQLRLWKKIYETFGGTCSIPDILESEFYRNNTWKIPTTTFIDLLNHYLTDLKSCPSKYNVDNGYWKNIPVLIRSCHCASDFIYNDECQIGNSGQDARAQNVCLKYETNWMAIDIYSRYLYIWVKRASVNSSHTDYSKTYKVKTQKDFSKLLVRIGANRDNTIPMALGRANTIGDRDRANLGWNTDAYWRLSKIDYKRYLYPQVYLQDSCCCTDSGTASKTHTTVTHVVSELSQLIPDTCSSLSCDSKNRYIPEQKILEKLRKNAIRIATMETIKQKKKIIIIQKSI